LPRRAAGKNDAIGADLSRISDFDAIGRERNGRYRALNRKRPMFVNRLG
jgi:hypothetical protein